MLILRSEQLAQYIISARWLRQAEQAAHIRVDTDKFECTIIDAPGHKDFVKNMIAGASQADAAVLVVAANDGVNAQTKEHVFLSKVIGVNQLIVAINKMDISGVDYAEAKWNAVKEEVSKLLQTTGYKSDKIQFLAITSYPGDNIGISVRGFGKKDVARGDVIGHPDNVPTVASAFTAQMVVLNHPSVITVGYAPVFHIHAAQVACRIEAIEKKLNPATGEVLAENPDFIKNGDGDRQDPPHTAALHREEIVHPPAQPVRDPRLWQHCCCGHVH